MSAGQAASLDLPLKLENLVFGGSAYRPDPASPRATVDVSRTLHGWALRLRYEVCFRGPCVRCLGEARVDLAIDSREVDQRSDTDDDSDLECPYLDRGVLDVSHWATDAVALDFPTQPLCSMDCGGICPVCGERLFEGEETHPHARVRDPRMADLDQIEFD